MNSKIDDPNCTSEYDGDIEIPELGKWYSWEEVMTLAVFTTKLAGYGFVYIYYDMVNKKYYVGVCRQSVRKRARQHYNKTNKLTYIEDAIKDIGCNRILVCIVKVCKVEDLVYFENYFIDTLNTMHPNGYNTIKSGYISQRATLQEKLARELPKDRLLNLLNSGYTYRKIKDTILSFKVSCDTLSTYGRSLGIILKQKGVISPTEVAELANKGYSNSEIARELKANSKSTIASIRYQYNIPNLREQTNRKPVLKIDPNSGLILAEYVSIVEAAEKCNLVPTAVSWRLKVNKVVKGVYLVYKDEYLKQQRSSTQGVEEISLEN